MLLYLSVVIAIGLAVIWAGVADERNARQGGETLRRQPEQGGDRNWPAGRLPPFAEPSATDSRATINGSPYTTADKGGGQLAA